MAMRCAWMLGVFWFWMYLLKLLVIKHLMIHVGNYHLIHVGKIRGYSLMMIVGCYLFLTDLSSDLCGTVGFLVTNLSGKVISLSAAGFKNPGGGGDKKDDWVKKKTLHVLLMVQKSQGQPFGCF